jgi:hypothetical protein
VNIDEMYKHFGPAVLREVRMFTLQTGNLTSLLAKLHIPSGPTLDAQHVALRNFIYQYGVAFFLAAIKENVTPEEVERMKARKLLQVSRQERRKGSRVWRSVEEMREDSLTNPSPKSTGNSQAGATAPGSPRRRRDDPPASEAFIEKTSVSTPRMEKKPAAEPQAPYTGRERRNGHERRKVSVERRRSLDIVYKNRRFGGDRRKAVRRQADREKLLKEK